MKIRIILVISLSMLLSLMFYSGSSLTARASAMSSGPRAMPTPVVDHGFTGYRGINIGTPRDVARAKLGEPREKSDAQDYYMIGEGECVQVVYDADGTVKTISTSYFGEKVKPPAAKDIFGTDVESNAEGAINKLVKYPKAGIWISYVRTAGQDPMVMITIQKMYKDET